MDLLHSGRFDGFCLVSSDSDFTRLASRLREQGADDFGFGEQKTPESFRQARRKFIYARLDEALSLAIGFGRVRPGSDVFEAEFLAGFGEMPREIARAVVGH